MTAEPRFRSRFALPRNMLVGLWYFDFDGDGEVDGYDNGQIDRRFGFG